jgi:hypothetical protein
MMGILIAAARHRNRALVTRLGNSNGTALNPSHMRAYFTHHSGRFRGKAHSKIFEPRAIFAHQRPRPLLFSAPFPPTVYPLFINRTGWAFEVKDADYIRRRLLYDPTEPEA